MELDIDKTHIHKRAFAASCQIDNLVQIHGGKNNQGLLSDLIIQDTDNHKIEVATEQLGIGARSGGAMV